MAAWCVGWLDTTAVWFGRHQVFLPLSLLCLVFASSTIVHRSSPINTSMHTSSKHDHAWRVLLFCGITLLSLLLLLLLLLPCMVRTSVNFECISYQSFHILFASFAALCVVHITVAAAVAVAASATCRASATLRSCYPRPATC